jgi:hypothetical protein
MLEGATPSSADTGAQASIRSGLATNGAALLLIARALTRPTTISENLRP